MVRCGRSLRVALLACCLAVALTAGAGLTTGSVAPSEPPSLVVDGDSSAALADQPEPWDVQDGDQPAVNNTIIRIELAANGSATWTLRIRTRLASEADVEEYRTFQAAFRENTSEYLGAFERRMTGVVANADEQFPREMRATDFAASTSIQEVPQRWGVVTYEFTWHGFAAAEDGRVVVGDAFAGGFFIDDGDVLEIVAPPEYAVAETDPAPAESRADAAEWHGREDFADGRPRLVAERTDAGSGTASGVDPVVPAVLGAAVLVVVVVAVGAVRLRDSPGGPVAAVRRRFGAGGDEAGGTGAAHDGAAVTDQAAGTGSDAEPLLTDEDRVGGLLDERGGRMKQSDIVDELGWSKSKGSRVLSSMAEEGRIRKLRIGRENIIERQDGQADASGAGGEQGDQ
jgi:hypothetical protein